MKNIVINDNQLNENDIEEKVIRVKALIINSKGKIILAHNNNTYQFPGGHKNEDETNEECIIREVKEETGINLTVEEPPFLCITTYDDNYFNSGRKVLNSIYYYRFFTDQEPNFLETHYDELELSTDFNLFYINFKDLDSFLQMNINSGDIDAKIGREMLYVVDVYRQLFSD